MKNNKITFKSVSDLKSHYNNKDYIVKNIVAKEEMVLLAAQPAAGKTLLALDMAICIALGIDWHGYKTKKKKVCYILGEGRSGVIPRIQAWEKENGLTVENADLFISNATLPVDTKEGLIEIVLSIKETNIVPDIIIIDTYSRSLLGDENSAACAGEFVRNCNEISNIFSGCAIVVIHHTGKSDKTSIRGSSALTGAADKIFILNVENDKTRVLKCIKSKDDPENNPIFFRLKQVDLDYLDDDGEKVTSAILERIADQPQNISSNSEREFALECLALVIKRDGSASNNTWRDEFYTTMQGKKEPNAVRAAFSRYKSYFIENGIVNESNNSFSIA